MKTRRKKSEEIAKEKDQLMCTPCSTKQIVTALVYSVGALPTIVNCTALGLTLHLIHSLLFFYVFVLSNVSGFVWLIFAFLFWVCLSFFFSKNNSISILDFVYFNFSNHIIVHVDQPLYMLNICFESYAKAVLTCYTV